MSDTSARSCSFDSSACYICREEVLWSHEFVGWFVCLLCSVWFLEEFESYFREIWWSHGVKTIQPVLTVVHDKYRNTSGMYSLLSSAMLSFSVYSVKSLLPKQWRNRVSTTAGNLQEFCQCVSKNMTLKVSKPKYKICQYFIGSNSIVSIYI